MWAACFRGNRPLNNISDSQYIDQLKAERDRFVAFAFSAADMLVEMDRSNCIVFAAGATGALLGRQPDQLRGNDFFDLIAPSDRKSLREALAKTNGNERIDTVLVQVVGNNGATTRVSLSGYHMADLGNRFFMSFSVPRLAQGTDHMPYASRDRETGLLDSESFVECAEAVVRHGINGGPVGEMTVLSLGDYEALRERVSEEGMRNLMREIGGRLRAHTEDGMAAGRLSTDKLGLVHRSPIAVETFTNAIQKAAAAIDPRGQGLDVASVSVKLESFGLDEEDALRAVTHVIREFTKAGHGRFRLRALEHGYDTMLRDAAERVSKLRRMIEERDFRPVFQPIVDLKTGEHQHYEALARFGSGKGRKPNTLEVIRFAEDVGMIGEFDLVMCERVVEIIDSGPGWERRPPVAVNVSGRSLASRFFVDALHEMLARYPAARRRILFEITESAEIEDLETVNGVIQELRGAGHKVCLDDFGSGAAAFQYLKTLNVDLVKIDGAYVRDSLKNGQAQAFLKSITSLCIDLNIETIGEMIENSATANFLITHGVRYGQGYLYGKPSPDLPILASPAD